MTLNVYHGSKIWWLLSLLTFPIILSQSGGKREASRLQAVSTPNNRICCCYRGWGPQQGQSIGKLRAFTCLPPSLLPPDSLCSVFLTSQGQNQVKPIHSKPFYILCFQNGPEQGDTSKKWTDEISDTSMASKGLHLPPTPTILLSVSPDIPAVIHLPVFKC